MNVQQKLTDILTSHPPDCVGFEPVHLFRDRTVVLATAKVVGVMESCFSECGIPTYFFKFGAVRQGITGNKSANKESARNVARRALRVDIDNNDVGDASAVALMCLWLLDPTDALVRFRPKQRQRRNTQHVKRARAVQLRKGVSRVEREKRNARIMALHRGSMSYRDIAKQVGVSTTTVSYTIEQHKETDAETSVLIATTTEPTPRVRPSEDVVRPRYHKNVKHMILRVLSDRNPWTTAEKNSAVDASCTGVRQTLRKQVRSGDILKIRHGVYQIVNAD